MTMIKSRLEEKMMFLNPDLVKFSDSEIIVEEKIREGMAKLVCKLNGYGIAFTKLDDNKLPYIKHKKCADTITTTIKINGR